MHQAAHDGQVSRNHPAEADAPEACPDTIYDTFQEAEDGPAEYEAQLDRSHLFLRSQIHLHQAEADTLPA